MRNIESSLRASKMHWKSSETSSLFGAVFNSKIQPASKNEYWREGFGTKKAKSTWEKAFHGQSPLKKWKDDAIVEINSRKSSIRISSDSIIDVRKDQTVQVLW